MYRNYIFDLYGTLLDIRTDEEQEGLWDEMAFLYGKEGAVYTPEALKTAYGDACRKEEERLREETGFVYPEIEIGQVFLNLFSQKGAEAGTELVSGLARRFRERSREYMRLYDGTEPLLRKLREGGKRIYLLSNAQRLFTAPEIAAAGIGGYFDDIFLSSDFGMKKPEKAYMETLLKKHGLKREECLMFGNEAESDLAVAQKCGVDGLLVSDGHFPKEPFAL